MSDVSTLAEVEKKLRKPDNDRAYLAAKLIQLAHVVAHGQDVEDGLVRGALGGMTYAINRLRELWAAKEENPSARTTAELEEIYAQVELSRFDTTVDAARATAQAYLKDSMLVDVSRITLDDGREFFAHVSRRDQTTVDGRKIYRGQPMDSLNALVPSFEQVFWEIQKPKNR